MHRERVGLVGEIPPGTNKIVIVRGREVAVFNVRGEFYALSNRCPHEGANLSRGILTGLPESSAPGCYELSRPGEVLRCPWHGWEFDLKTGKSVCDPRRLFTRSYKTSVDACGERVEGDLMAETFPVVVEEAVVFVEM
ncbi:Rieske (2Fe-2S) protein [Tardiphaga sp.]|uniref:Rieske (2Fe-2S) protein n=1 Tax=Tardiphaga sp. TaxID=1926292 RepID=UPI002620D63C|nr:Rieske (2Fe-2S) protein [Tardiphaga sp.]MDB5619717.1 Ferredoxin subunit of nitrite reductase and ring-hydroxylating dioxygenase [Tardiphaga sp.]